jgi:hypothetical protein
MLLFFSSVVILRTGMLMARAWFQYAMHVPLFVSHDHFFNYFVLSLVQKKSSEGGKQSGPLKKLKKDKVVGATGKNNKSEASMVSAAPCVKPELTLPAMYNFILSAIFL